MIEITKQCSLCGGEYATSFFNKNRKTRDGLHAWCKLCCRKAEKIRYSIVKEEKLRQVRAWQNENVEKVKEYKKNWRAKSNSTDAPSVGGDSNNSTDSDS